MINQNSINTVLTFTTPGLIQLLMNNHKVNAEEAALLLYNSNLYKKLETEDTKLWYLGYPTLYAMLEEEMNTSKNVESEV